MAQILLRQALTSEAGVQEVVFWNMVIVIVTVGGGRPPVLMATDPVA
jgi:hypothetical protein